MPRPVFDINEYELRGLVPDVYTEEQKALLNKTLARANGQIDWAAQMLGFNGPGYWGRPNVKADGSYDWIGLPETMNEKRQMQTGAFGVYNKHLPYEQWPAPFNRSEVRASGDASISVWEKDGKTVLGPLGHPQTLNYSYNPTFYVGATYIFDAEVEFTAGSSDLAEVVWSTTFPVGDVLWTRAKIKQDSGLIGVRIINSEANETFVEVRSWEDSSDWNYSQVTSQFLGMWGNKGASLSFDHAFDSLDVHGFDEHHGLSLNDLETELSLSNLLARVGLEPTRWTPFSNTHFGIKIGGCDVVYPIPVSDLGAVYDNSIYDRDVTTKDDFLLGGTLSDFPPTGEVTSEGLYERGDEEYPILIPDDFLFYTCESDCNYTLELKQTYDVEQVVGIGNISFKYDAISDCAKVEFPCVEWVFDPTLDDGTLEEFDIYPERGPWATANDGIYEETQLCFQDVQQGQTSCEGGQWCGFDDGEYDEVVEPNCDLDPIVPGCEIADGGMFTVLGPPDYDACNCAVECCEINGETYVYNVLPDNHGEIVDNGEYLVYSACITFDNGEYERVFAVECTLDNGDIDSATPPVGREDSRQYDRVLLDCTPCTDDGNPEVIPCPVEPVYVSLADVFAEATWSMNPTVRNSDTPLRLWKSRPLTALDSVPVEGTTQYNYLLADENQGPDELGAYRHFARMPLEYPREGKFWNRTQAVCNNQSYFSAPTNLSETDATPSPLRPGLYSADYATVDSNDSTVLYEESFLVSQVYADSTEVQEGFSDSATTFDPVTDAPFAPAVIIDYNAFEARIPQENGEWRGSYYIPGINQTRTGFLFTDLASQSLQEVPYDEFPVYDMSSIKRPNVEFPDDPDKAALKNYVVSYAYFVADFSASEDPVFDPQVKHCWRREAIACSTPSVNENGIETCVDSSLESNTAYLLHTSY